MPKKTPSFLKKKVIVWGGFLALGVLILSFIFGPGPIGFVMDVAGPPPENHQERQAWLSANVDNMNHDQFIKLDYKVPSWKELDEMNQSLADRTYPDFIAATQTYGTLPNLVESLYFGDVLKDTGINTQFIHANYWYKGGEFKLWYLGYKNPMDLNQDQSKRALVHNILLAREQGLAVILFPDYVQLENGGMNELGIAEDLEGRLETIALDLAEIAEKYKVEYLVPSNQIEMILESNGYEVAEAQQRTNDFYASIVPQMREKYSGKIMYKMGGFGDWSRYDAISLEGADVFGFTGCYNRKNYDIDFVVDDIRVSAAQANKLSRKYDIPWINAEFLVSDEENSLSYGTVEEELPIEDYYEAGLAAFNRYGSRASGFTVHSLLGSGKVYDTPVMPMLKEFFTSK